MSEFGPTPQIIPAHYESVIAQSPAFIAVLTGENFVFEMANPRCIELIGHRDVIGKSVKDALPEVEDQGFIQLLQGVFTSGRPYMGIELPVNLLRGGKTELRFVDMVYQCLEKEGAPHGIFVHGIDVTDKVLARKALEESEKLFRDYADAMPQMAFIADIKGQYTYFNERWRSYTGELKDVPIHHPDDALNALEKWNHSLTTGAPYEIEYRLKNFNGEYRWHLGRAIPLKNESGEIIRWVGTNTDIHDKKVSEKLLQDSERQLKMITDAIPAMITYIDRQYVYRFVNKFYEDWFLRPASDFLGKSIPELWGEEIFQSRKPTLDRALRGETVHIEISFNHPELGPRILESTYVPDRSTEGKVGGVIALVFDRTDERNEKRKRLETEEKLQLALASGQMGLWHFDLITQQVTTSPELDEILGTYETDGSIDAVNEVYIYPEDRPEVEKAWMEAVKTKRPYAKEYRIIRPTGEVRWLYSTGRPSYDASGRPLSLSGVTIDVTNRKRNEVSLNDALKSRDEFLSIASHELKTPLTSLMIQSQLQKRMMDRNEDNAFSKDRVKKVMELVEGHTFRLKRLVDDMLDISRIRAGKLSLQKERLGLHSLILDILVRMDPEFLVYRSGKPSLTGPDIEGFWDPLRIDQIITNLLTNALRYGNSNPIEMSTSAENGLAYISIRDQGIGISAVDQGKIFNRFERAVNANDVSGLGLGLYIADQIVKAHEGRMWVESELGRGSTFHIELPLKL